MGMIRRAAVFAGCFMVTGLPSLSLGAGKTMFELPTRIQGDTLFIGPAGELTLSG